MYLSFLSCIAVFYPADMSMNLVLNILTLLGSLGLFLFGMKVMSESLQKAAGTRLRTILEGITSNRFRSILTGFVITGIVQSSSAVTVMIVSFVNAGLLSLYESIPLIMGANIGTTVTAWLISLLGFNLSISQLALPLIGIGFPLIFSRKSNRRNFGEFMIGFALIFIGLEFIKSTVPDMSTRPELLEFVSGYTDMGVLSVLMFLVGGIAITLFIQSSSAAMALTLVMCYRGWINYELAGAMILGENIGTTVTANFAALVANRPARRSALAHVVFNLFGTMWALPLLRPMLHLIDASMTTLNLGSPVEDIHSIPIALSVFHSLFNIINTLLLSGFVHQIEKLVTRIIPSRGSPKDHYRLKYITTGLFSTSELSILQARKKIALYGKRTYKMFITVRNLFRETNEERFNNFFRKIDHDEQICDRMEVEIATYLTRLSEDELSHPGSKRIRAMLKLIDDIESIGDSCNNIAEVFNRKKTEKIWFPQMIRDRLNTTFDLIEKGFVLMIRHLEHDAREVDLPAAVKIGDLIKDHVGRLRKEHLENIENRNYKYQAGVVYNDILEESARLGHFIFNISETISFTETPESGTPSGE